VFVFVMYRDMHRTRYIHTCSVLQLSAFDVWVWVRVSSQNHAVTDSVQSADYALLPEILRLTGTRARYIIKRYGINKGYHVNTASYCLEFESETTKMPTIIGSRV